MRSAGGGFWTIRILLSVVVLALAAASADAQQPISGNYPGGAVGGMKAAMIPPPGSFLLENGTLFYNTREFVDGSGETIPTETSNVVANRTIFGYATPWKILGGNYLAAVILALANAPLRPQPDSERDFQLGDLVLQPFALGWNHGTVHTQFAYNVWLPTGRFNAGASNNVGKGLYSHMLSYGATWLQDEQNPWAVTATLRYEFVGKQKDTDIEPGDVLILEVAAGKEVARGFDLGLTGYYMTQTTEEKGSAPGTDTTRYRAAGLGPELSWRPSRLPGFQVALKSYFEFAARNTSQGVFTVLSLAYVFGGAS
ncbi:MAG: transporter [Acidimicrobiia bacterium]